MTTIRKYLCVLLVLLFTTGCSSMAQPQQNNESSSENTSTLTSSLTVSESELFTDRDYEVGYDETTCIMITLTGDSAVCTSDEVKINGTTVTLIGEGPYCLSGTLEGMILVDADASAKPRLILNGASVTSQTSAALYVKEAEKVFVTLGNNTQNLLANGGSFDAVDENTIDGAVFSKQDITFNGTGSLTVTAPVGHGIVCKDDLVFTGGSYTVNAASHGLDANDSVRIANASFALETGKDGIHAENSDDTDLGFVYMASGSLTVNAQGDGISAGAFLQIKDGAFSFTAGGGSVNGTKEQSDSYGGFMGGHGGYYGQQSSAESDDSGTSMKGLKATADLVIQNGTFTIDSADDAIHSNASVTINGGTYNIKSGDDAFHADETLTVSGGTVNITESYEGLEGLNVLVAGGDITLTADDDGVNAAGGNDQSGFGGHRGGDTFGRSGGGYETGSSGGSVTITGGNLQINASGDGIDANGTLEITDGTVSVSGPTMGDTAVLDYDATATITGGTFIGTGAYQMAQTFSDSGQGVIAVSVGNRQAGTELSVKDGENVILTYTPPLDYAIVIISSPQMEKGKSYTLCVGTDSESFTAS